MGPLRRLAFGIQIRTVGRLKGLRRDDILEVTSGVNSWSREDWAAAAEAHKQQTGKEVPAGVITGADEGGSPIIDFFKWLLQWLASPEGQGFLKFIFSLFGFIIV